MPPPPRTNSRGGSGEVNIEFVYRNILDSHFLQILEKITIKNKISKLFAKIFKNYQQKG